MHPVFNLINFDRTEYRACFCVFMSISERVHSKCQTCDAGPRWGEKSRLCGDKNRLLILLLSRSVGMENVLRGSRSRIAHTHNALGRRAAASQATWRARIMTSIMSPYREGESESELPRKKVREREGVRESTFLPSGCRSPIVAGPAGAFSPRLQLIGCPTMRGRGGGDGVGWAINIVKCLGRGGLGCLFFFFFFFFLEGEGALCAPRGQSYSRLAPLSLSPFIFIPFFFFFPLSQPRLIYFPVLLLSHVCCSSILCDS